MLARLCLTLAFFAFFARIGLAEDIPTTLTCTANAKAFRDYSFGDKQWSGVIPPDPANVFRISTVKQSQSDDPLRGKVFSSLNTPNPVIRSITPPRQARYFPEGDAVEFKGAVVSRWGDSVFIMWRNDYGNKVWLAVVDRQHKKAVVNQVFEGITSAGSEAETLDCR